MSTPYQRALDAGYSEQEIQDYLSQSDPKFKQAIDQGYSPEEVTEFLKTQPKPKEDGYSILGQKFSPKETSVFETLRHVGRSGARAVETALGAPRALGEFGESLIPEKLLKKGAEKIGLKEPVEKGLEFVKEHAPYKLFPTSEQVRDVGKKIFGKKLEPKNEWESKADEIVEDFTALSLPGPEGKVKFAKPLLIALGANVVPEVIKKMGGTEKEQAYGKGGTILLSSLINPGKANALKEELYSKARNARPERARITAPKLNPMINAVERKLKEGGTEPWKDKIFTKIKELREKITGNSVEVGELEKFKTSLNNIASELYTEKNVSRPGIKSAQRYTQKLNKAVDQGLKEYGKANPEWEAFYRPANEVHGAIAQSHKARNFIGRIAKKYGHHAILPLVGLGHAGGATALASTAGGAAATALAIGGGEIAVKAFKSKEIQKLYANLIQHALKEDAVAVANTLSKLEKELKRSQSESIQPK